MSTKKHLYCHIESPLSIADYSMHVVNISIQVVKWAKIISPLYTFKYAYWQNKLDCVYNK